MGAHEDWLKDRDDRGVGGEEGYPGVDFDGFYDSMFELIDIWSPGTQAACMEYSAYTPVGSTMLLYNG